MEQQARFCHWLTYNQCYVPRSKAIIIHNLESIMLLIGRDVYDLTPYQVNFLRTAFLDNQQFTEVNINQKRQYAFALIKYAGFLQEESLHVW